jgi:hypothetical protein
MPKRRDFLEKLSEDDPNYEIGKRFYLEAWADSHGLVADAFAGKASLADLVEGCVKSVEQGARTQVAIQNAETIPSRLRELDVMVEKSIRLVGNSLQAHSKRFGKTRVKAAIAEFSRRAREIAARSKQQILKGVLAQQMESKGKRADFEATCAKLAATLSPEVCEQLQAQLLEIGERLARTDDYLRNLLQRLGAQQNLEDDEEFWLQLWAAARYLGFSNVEFWKLTPREFCAVLELKARELKRRDPSTDDHPSVGNSAEVADDHGAEDVHVGLLLKIVAKKTISIETWARDHRLGRTTVFDWKKARVAGNCLKGKVSDPKTAEIETAIENDAQALGLTTRIRSD